MHCSHHTETPTNQLYMAQSSPQLSLFEAKCLLPRYSQSMFACWIYSNERSMLLELFRSIVSVFNCSLFCFCLGFSYLLSPSPAAFDVNQYILLQLSTMLFQRGIRNAKDRWYLPSTAWQVQPSFPLYVQALSQQ